MAKIDSRNLPNSPCKPLGLNVKLPTQEESGFQGTISHTWRHRFSLRAATVMKQSVYCKLGLSGGE